MSTPHSKVNSSETEALAAIFKFTSIFALYILFYQMHRVNTHYCRAGRINRNSCIEFKEHRTLPGFDRAQEKKGL
jgi:hypothetical protein